MLQVPPSSTSHWPHLRGGPVGCGSRRLRVSLATVTNLSNSQDPPPPLSTPAPAPASGRCNLCGLESMPFSVAAARGDAGAVRAFPRSESVNKLATSASCLSSLRSHFCWQLCSLLALTRASRPVPCSAWPSWINCVLSLLWAL